jgi:thiol-disulfide isomerase/thioredoxin
MNKPTNNDWRFELLGSIVQSNQSSDEESPSTQVPTLQAVDKEFYDCIAILFVANYCPHCKLFALHVVASAAALEGNKCKVIV